MRRGHTLEIGVTLVLLALASSCAPRATSATTSTTVADSSTTVPRSTSTSTTPVGIDGGPLATIPASEGGFAVPQYAEIPEENDFMLECMTWYGFSGKIDTQSGEGLLFDTPSDQMDKFAASITDCGLKYRLLAGMDVGIPDDDTLRQYYQAWLLAYQCLQDHDYPVTPPPSEDAWVESQGEWSPFDEIMRLNEAGSYSDQEFWDELAATCPPDLETWLDRLNQ